MQYLITILLLLVLLLSVSLERYYSNAPINELRRKRRKGDAQASLVYEVVRNISLAKYYLATVALISFAILVAYLSQHFSLFKAAIAVLVVIGLCYLVRVYSRHISLVAVKFAPHFAFFIVATRPYAIKIKQLLSWARSPAKDGSEIYEKEDLIHILNSQKEANNNRIEKTEIDLAIHALTFGEKKVKDYMTPRKVVRFVRSDEPVSTVLMSELHDSGFSRFPVYMDETDNIVGTLFLKDLVERRMTGKVFSAMSNEFYVVQEDESLEETLKQFLLTQHHLFIVKNQFHEVVGVITIEDVIEQIMGRKIVDEFDKHEDMREHASSDEPS